ncbi:hypothetical protein A2714_01940 [Candidatus Woesebacteria bacterium RIFCSPHIGHO2_01_FULL_38_9]|uniref:N-acetylglucosaminylphosphatidylinositol deacetylase n=2 Tax=Candidatus Woeseibacteriota TaxID=1752722 RepID=A0A1F7Y1A5_9BACT|nr:MAG: hypothetical protein A2714_01940 [Candidatus Woesebacteria bacterium RIFCSPHIGHO2_01_FULL_38_9]OGM60160.1 MAG: hypothetical protein A3A75_05665 [Candidatus Woesebacteria bacterium RIFCSPLOWO2_01_FULL_39_10]
MRKTVCIFAHPDDEAFGPSGTIAKFADEGEVFLICVTNGNDKNNGERELIKIRDQELHESSKILGVKKVYCLKYADGELCNNKYHEVVGKIEKILKKIQPDTLITFEARGVSGHIDHMFCSMIASYIFRENRYIKRLLYFCMPKVRSLLMKDYFIYFPPGYTKKEVDIVVDISKYWNLKIESIKAHQSQKKDVERVLNLLRLGNFLRFLPKEEYFLVLKR